jgi:carbon-monoxide dehydrogenase large subunit
VISRVHAQYMEPRGALGVYDPGEERYTLYADVQYPHPGQTALAGNILRSRASDPRHRGRRRRRLRTKGWQYPEHRLVLWAARRSATRSNGSASAREAIPRTSTPRDNVSEAELALDADGRFLGLRVRTLANVGAYVSSDRNLLATFSNVFTLGRRLAVSPRPTSR